MSEDHSFALQVLEQRNAELEQKIIKLESDNYFLRSELAAKKNTTVWHLHPKEDKDRVKIDAKATVTIPNMDVFLGNILAAKNFPESYYNMTLNKLRSGEWRAYQYNAKKPGASGWRADAEFSDGFVLEAVLAMFCWESNFECCFSTEDYLRDFVEMGYVSKGRIIF